MSKKTQRRKAEARARQRARRITVGKVARLALKSVLFAVVASLLLALLEAFGIPGLRNPWIQGGAIVALYLLAYPLLMSEFRAARYRDEAE